MTALQFQGELKHPGQEEQGRRDELKKKLMTETDETVPSAVATTAWLGLSYPSSATIAADDSRAGARLSITFTRVLSESDLSKAEA